MKFARIVFTIAGIWGLLVLPPLYFLEQKIGRDTPPAITHPEYFYGFIGVALAFQFIFLVIGSNPARYRAMMLPSMVEKFSFVIACALLYSQHRIAGPILGGSMADLLLGILFVISFPENRSGSTVQSCFRLGYLPS
jgi:hypothetical protein